MRWLTISGMRSPVRVPKKTPLFTGNRLECQHEIARIRALEGIRDPRKPRRLLHEGRRREDFVRRQGRLAGAALRKALGAFYPVLDAVHLYDYKVRILDSGAATGAKTRVTIESTDGSLEWSTMGSDTNIIAASATALGDSLEYAIWKRGAELRRRDERHFTTMISAEGAR